MCTMPFPTLWFELMIFAPLTENPFKVKYVNVWTFVHVLMHTNDISHATNSLMLIVLLLLKLETYFKTIFKDERLDIRMTQKHF